jgi:prephenate dehydrogenase
MKTQTITIVGLNKTGASIGLALKKSSLMVTLIGHDADAARARAVLETVGAVDKVEWNLVSAAKKADILVITTPANEVETVLQVIGDALQPHTLVLDLSALKGPALGWAQKYLQQGHYVGAVPVLAAAALDDGRSAVETASADLFRNSALCLMPAPQAEPQAVETAVNFGLLLGARPFFVEAHEFDSLVQGTETLPRLVAVAMFSALQKATGWRDSLRFAGLSFALGTAPLAMRDETIFMALQNKEATLGWLDALMQELAQMRRWLYDGNRELFTAFLEELDNEREAWLAARAKNDWDERKGPAIRPRTLSEHMFGGLVSGRKDDDDA